MDRRVAPPKRVTSTTWGPPPPCTSKPTLNLLLSLATSRPHKFHSRKAVKETRFLGRVDVSEQRCRDRSHARASSTKDEGLFRSVDSDEPSTQLGISCLHIPVEGFRLTQRATKSSKVNR